MRILALLALITVSSSGVGAQSAPSTSKRLFVKAVDRVGAPVTGLTAADFFLAEGKKERKIIRLVPAGHPLRIVLLVDDSKSMTSALTGIRSGLLGFFDAVPAPHEIAFVTIGNTPVVRQEPTASRDALKGLAQKMSTNGSLVLFSGVLEMYGRFLGKIEDRWSTLVIVAGDGDDASRGVTDEQFTAVAKDMQATDTVVHAVILTLPGKSSGGPGQIARGLVKATGGTYESVGAAGALPDKLAAVARTIMAQHQVTSAQYILDYETDTPGSPDPPKLASTREGVSLTLSQQGRMR